MSYEPHNRAVRNWYARNKEKYRKMKQDYRSKEENRIKENARAAVFRAVRDGKLTKQPCEVCGKIKVEGHHEDYSKPLEVKWFCSEHHPI